MKIALVHTMFTSKGGGERFLYEVFKRLKNNYEVHIFCNDIGPETFSFQEFNHTVIPARHDLLGKFVAYYEAKALRKTLDHAIKWKPDLIWLNRGYYYASLIIERYKIKVIPYVHYPTTPEQLRGKMLHKIYRKIIGLESLESESFARVPIVLCNSKYTEAAIKREQPNARTKVIYPAVDHDKFFPTWEDEGYLYYNSRFQRIKNHELAVEIARKTGYRLILSGFVGKNNMNYFNYIKKKSEGLSVEMLQNPVDETIVRLLQKCSIFLFPSIGEHFGMAPVEAMACGKPVVAHESGGTIETVGKTGILCSDDPEEWVRAVQYLMGNEDVRKELGRKAFEFSKLFTWENTVNEIQKIFEILEKETESYL